MSCEHPDPETTVSRAHRLLRLVKLVVTTLAAVLGIAKTLGWV